MKKSSAVPASFCAAVAILVLEGCSSRPSVRRCVDPSTGFILPDSACTSLTTLNTFRGRYAMVTSDRGYVCVDIVANKEVPRNFCAGSGYYSGRYWSRGRLFAPSWGYDGTPSSNGYVRNFRSSPPDGADIHNSSGRVIQRGGFGSSGRSSGGFFG